MIFINIEYISIKENVARVIMHAFQFSENISCLCNHRNYFKQSYLKERKSKRVITLKLMI